MMAQIMTSDSTFISVDEWWWWWWCARLFVSSLPPQAYTASSPRRTNEMTIGGSYWAPSQSHTHTRRPRLSEGTPGRADRNVYGLTASAMNIHAVREQWTARTPQTEKRTSKDERQRSGHGLGFLPFRPLFCRVWSGLGDGPGAGRWSR